MLKLFSSLLAFSLVISGFLVVNAGDLHSADSLKLVASREKNPELKARMLIKIANLLIDQKDKNSYVFAENAWKIADSIRNDELLAEAAVAAGIAFRLRNNYSKSASFLISATDRYRALGKIPETGYCLRQLSETYRASGELSQAEKYLLQALRVYTSLNDTLNLAVTYNRLAATTYEQYYNDPEFLKIFDKKIKDPLVFRQAIDAVPVLWKRVLLLNHYIRQTLLYSENERSLRDNKISTGIIKAGLLGSRMQYEEACALLYTIVDSIKAGNNQDDLPLALFNLSTCLLGAGKPEQAEIVARESYRLALEKDIKIYLILSAKALHEVYVALGDYQKAYHYLDLFIRLRRENYNADVDLKLNEVKYSSELRHRELEISNRDTRIRLIVLSFTGISLTIVIFIIVLFFKNKKLSVLNNSLRESNRVISDQNQQLVKLNSERTLFFSIIAHDLRNPLSGFRSLTELMASGMSNMTNDEIKQALNLLKTSSDRIYELLENLLQWSRIQNGLITYTPEKLSLTDMLVDCAGLLEGAATSKNIIIRVLVSHDCRVTGDRKMLETVIRNLASNAIKFSYPNNEIRLRCAINSEVMTVSVEDDGAGMTEETLASLFNQEPSKPDEGTRGETGTGLGLILCRDFLLKHNSELKIQSKPGKGSIFSFSLKVTPE